MSDNLLSTIAGVFGIASFAAATMWLNSDPTQNVTAENVTTENVTTENVTTENVTTHTITVVKKRARRPPIAPALPLLPPSPVLSDTDEEVTITKTTTVTKRYRRPPIAPIVKPTEYSPEEVARMNDYELAEAWILITGCTHLSCTHCKGERPIVPYWINSIRKRCMKKTWAGSKGGLHKDTILPSTCDAQQARNSTCNPINNPAYSKLRSAKTDETEKKEVVKQREAGLKAIGLKPRSYKHTV